MSYNLLKKERTQLKKERTQLKKERTQLKKFNPRVEVKLRFYIKFLH